MARISFTEIGDIQDATFFIFQVQDDGSVRAVTDDFVDVTVGVTEEDDRIAAILRRADKPTFLAVNKVDGENRENDRWDFTRLGLGEPHPVSALHGRRTGDLLDEIAEARRLSAALGALPAWVERELAARAPGRTAPARELRPPAPRPSARPPCWPCARARPRAPGPGRGRRR